VSERAWGTVREDYGVGDTAWTFFPHNHAISRTYRWGEDGIAGICDRHQFICFSLALWNGRDPFLKERFFGLTGQQGNHGEDVKECYFYLDSTPTHSWMRFLYKYPQQAFPYDLLIRENASRGKDRPEFDLQDTGIFDDNRHFDVVVEYAKGTPEDILIVISAINRGPEAAELHLLPTIWFRNTWSWTAHVERPALRAENGVIELEEPLYGHRRLYCDGSPELLFTDNVSNFKRLYGTENRTRYVKDGINDYVVSGERSAVNPAQRGTKAAARYVVTLPPGETAFIRLRLTDQRIAQPFNGDFDRIWGMRKAEADEFYSCIVPDHLSADGKKVMRQALAGMLWAKQFYYYDVNCWLEGDPIPPKPPRERLNGRNSDWRHLYNADIISMPDKWEYPWYAAWDLAFHCIPLALVDPEFAKDQLVLLLREWYMHPNGQLPAYEWNFGDVNPPVHAWAAWRVYKIEKKRTGCGDRAFLERVFHKLLLNFTWWVNRKDAEGRNIFQGGFLGLDNIGVFDRSRPLPGGGHLDQSDATSWMGMYCLNLLIMALELAIENQAYEDVASKFFEHFVYICDAMNQIGGERMDLWSEEDGFFYDILHLPGGRIEPVRIRSMVGLIPLFAVETLEVDMIDHLPGFQRRMQWFIENRPELGMHVKRSNGRYFLSLVSLDRLPRVLSYMFDEDEFLSAYGIRALSRWHKDHPFELLLDGVRHRIDYEPAESQTGLFGGNSNWRGPIWFPTNYLLVEALQKFHHFLGDDYKVPFPARTGTHMTLWDAAGEISRRLTSIFLVGPDGRRPVYGDDRRMYEDPNWSHLLLFFEYFNGDTGQGLGASHQTGWTGLVAKLLQQSGEPASQDMSPVAACGPE
jgi:hypothetical protein